MSMISFDNEYANWINELKQRFRNTQIKAALKVNSEMLFFNWQLGHDLVTKRVEERWGKGVVEQISYDLQQEFPGVKGFSARNLWFMKQWYSFYISDNDDGMIISDLVNKFAVNKSNLKQPVSEIQFPPIFALIPWGHHILIIQKCKTIDEAIYYIRRAIEDNLSRNALEKCIRIDSYHTAGSAFTNFEINLPDSQRQLAQELLKQNYGFSFMNLPRDYDEKSMEDAIEQRITTPMGVATYENVRIKEISDHLPTPEQIKKQIELAEEEYKMNTNELDDRNENRE